MNRSVIKIAGLIIALIFALFFPYMIAAPYEAPFFWNVICWGFINPILILFFCSVFLGDKNKERMKKIQASLTAKGYSKFSRQCTTWLILPLFLPTMITVFIYKLPVYPTVFFAKTSFERLVKVNDYICSGFVRRGIRHTTVYFIDNTAKETDDIDFVGNFCRDKPDLMKNLRGKYIFLQGREWSWGKFYDGFELVQAVSFNPANDMLPASYTLKNDNKTGVIALSVNCTNPEHSAIKGQYGFHNIYTPASTGIPFIEFPCDGSKQIKTFALNAGEYQFDEISYANKYITTLAPFFFTVKANTVTYLGNFEIKLDQTSVDVHSNDFHTVDLPLIMKQLPNIPIEKYNIDVIGIRKEKVNPSSNPLPPYVGIGDVKLSIECGNFDMTCSKK